MAVAYQNPHTLKIDHAFLIGDSNAEVRQKTAAKIDELRGAGMNIVGHGRIGRNRTCPCGSGFKFKKCCLARAT